MKAIGYRRAAAIAKNGIIFFRIGDVMPKSRKLFKL
jgi:hypothetical protein